MATLAGTIAATTATQTAATAAGLWIQTAAVVDNTMNTAHGASAAQRIHGQNAIVKMITEALNEGPGVIVKNTNSAGKIMFQAA